MSIALPSQFVGPGGTGSSAWAGGGTLAAPEVGVRATVSGRPNTLVRFAFYASVFCIPFARLYVPGTGERFGVIRIVQLLLLAAVVSQPALCLRIVPAAVLWFLAYCLCRVASGMWLTPELMESWWPTTFQWLQFSLPWVWIACNLLQFPQLRRKSLWALAVGCSLCALLHSFGIGVSLVDNSAAESRTSIFGENANIVGAVYAVAIVALVGLGMFKDLKSSRRVVILPLIAVLAIGLAKTGSRTAVLLVAIGVVVLLFQARAFASRARRYTLLAIIGVVLAGAVWQVPTVIERFRDLDPHDVGRDNPRARMAPVLLEIIGRSPVYGTGPERYRFELTRRAMPYLVREQQTVVAHNLVLLLLVETGLIGLLLFATGIWKALASAWKARFGVAGYLPLALLLPFVLSSMVVNDPSSNHVFWFAIAFALAEETAKPATAEV